MIMMLLAAGGLFLLALGAARVCARFGVPKVTGYLIVGIGAGPSASELLGLTPLLTRELIHELEPIHEIALALIVFTIGGSFHLQALRRGGLGLLRASSTEIAATGLFVGLATLAAGADLLTAAFLALMATTTAPAATRMVAREYESEGPMTDRIMVLIGLDNLFAAVAFVLLLGAIDTGAGLPAVARALGVPVGLGILAGLVLALLDQRLSGPGIRQLMILGVLSTLTGGCLALDTSAMLAAMIAGATLVNASPRDDRMLEELGAFDYPLYVLFFVLSGANLRLELLPQMGLVGVAYVVARVGGKLLGCATGGRIERAPKKSVRWLGPAMLAQAGLAIGLSSALARSWPGGAAVETAVLAAVVVFEGVGPVLTRLALVRAGEVTLVSLLAQRPAVSYAKGLHEIVNHFREALGIPEGHDVDHPADMMVAHIMRRSVEAVHQDVPFEEVLHAMGHTHYDRLPVIDDDGHLIGVIRYSDISSTLFEPILDNLVVASDMAVGEGVTLKTTDTIAEALAALKEHPDQTTLLVVDAEDVRRPVGVLRHNDVLSAHRELEGLDS